MNLRDELRSQINEAKSRDEGFGAYEFLREHGHALLDAVEDVERLDWVAKRGVSFRIEPREFEVNPKWWINCHYRTYIRAVDESVRFDSYRQAIDAARSQTVVR